MQALHTKHRPRQFKGLLGPARAVGESIRLLTAGGSPPRQVLLTGDHGTGKTTIARILASALNCTSLMEGEPCLQCEQCLNPTSVHEVNCADKTKVEDVRDIISSMRFRPRGAQVAVHIMDEAHMLSNSAMNALLKPAEEPPDYVALMLCSTEPSKIIPTLRNRLNRYNLGGLGEEDMLTLLHGVLEAEDVTDRNEHIVNALVGNANGCPRTALTELGKVLHNSVMLPEDEALSLIGHGQDEQDIDVRRLAVALVTGAPWGEICRLLDGVLKLTTPEIVRMVILSYMRAVLVSEKNGARIVALASAMIRLSEPLIERRPEMKLTAKLAHVWADLAG